MSKVDHRVYVVDDDRSSRQSVEFLLKVAGFKVQAFASAQEFLDFPRLELPGCLVLDVQMPGLTGLELQEQLSKLGFRIPIIFITGHGDSAMALQAMKAGAMAFLTKPFREDALLRSVTQAIERDQDPNRPTGLLRTDF
jgi:FixJ family two-component response regulator